MSDVPTQPFPSPDQDPTSPVRNALLLAITRNAQKAGASTEGDSRDAKDFGDACLSLAQAYSILDPNLLNGGETAQTRKASAPTPGEDHNRDGKIGQK